MMKMVCYDEVGTIVPQDLDRAAQLLDEKENRLKDEEEYQEKLWRERKISEGIARHRGMVGPEELVIEMDPSQVFWAMNRNPKVTVKLKDPMETQCNLFRKYTEKGEQGEFYWVYTEGI